MAKHRPTYTKEFKLAILAQVNSGLPVAQVARENGIHPRLWTAPNFMDYGIGPRKAHIEVSIPAGTFVTGPPRPIAERATEFFGDLLATGG